MNIENQPVFEPSGTSRVDVGYSASLTDLAHFEQALQQVRIHSGVGQLGVRAADKVSPMVEAFFQPLQQLNAEAQQLSESAARLSGAEPMATPGEVLQLTVLSHQFLFHSQLIANIANRTSDGLQQLFRQQS